MGSPRLRLGFAVVRSVGCSVRRSRFHHPSQAGNRHYPAGAPSSACGVLWRAWISSVVDASYSGLGSGVAEEFTAFGEPGDAKVRARMLDEGLTVLDGLWSGEPLTHHGQHYDVENVSLAPLQRPRIPIWIGGQSAPALRRAARWDGWLAPATRPDGTPIMDKDPWRIAEMVAEINITGGRTRPSTWPWTGTQSQ